MFLGVVFALFAALLATSAPALAEGGGSDPSVLTVRWNCPQANFGKETDLPGDADITFKYIASDPPRLDWSQWKTIAAQAAKSRTDYFPCFAEFERNVKDRAAEACLAHYRGPTHTNADMDAAIAECDDKRVPAAMVEMEQYHTRIGADALKRGALPPFSPGTSINDTTGTWSADPRKMPATRKRLHDFMSTECTVPTFKIELRAVALSSEFLSNGLPGALGATSGECRQKLLRSYLEAVAEYQPSPERCPPASTDPDCVRFRDGARAVLAAIGPYLRQEDQSLGADRLRDCATSTGNLSALFVALSGDVAASVQCKELAPGESMEVKSNDIGTGLPAAYRLTRNADGSFSADINARFEPASRQKEYTDKANQCLGRVDPFLKGPDGGQLHLKLTDQPQGSQGPPPATPISIITDAGWRADSTHWAEKIDCMTITHELMHKLGLVDEYVEKAMGHVYDPVTKTYKWVQEGATLPAQDCRKTGPADSIMSNQRAAYEKARGPEMDADCLCNKDLSDAQCAKALDKMGDKPEACPAGTVGRVNDMSKLSGFLGSSTELDLDPSVAAADAKVADSFKFSSSKRSRFVSYRGPGTGTVLLPAQFRAIVNPGCAAKNKLLYACSRPAYATSLANFGDGQNTERGCPKGTPEACNNPEEWEQ